MEDQLGRPKVARTYAWAVSLVPVLFLLFAALAGAGHGIDPDFIDIHRGLGDLFGLLAIFVLPPLGFLAGFPKRLRIGPLTVLLVVLWIIQALLGIIIEEGGRWAIAIHLHNPLLIFALGILLAVLAHKAVRRASAVAEEG